MLEASSMESFICKTEVSVIVLFLLAISQSSESLSDSYPSDFGFYTFSVLLVDCIVLSGWNVFETLALPNAISSFS